MFLWKYLSTTDSLVIHQRNVNICLDVPMLLVAVGSCYQNNWQLPVQEKNVWLNLIQTQAGKIGFGTLMRFT